MTDVYFTPTENDDYIVSFSFDRDVIDLIKCVHWQSRSWNPDKKVWTVHDHSVPYLIKLLKDMGHQTHWQKAESKAKAKANHKPSTNWAVTLFDRVGPERKEAVFKALSKVLHPDTPTGDHDLMRELLDGRG